VIVAVIADTHLPRGSRRLPDACVERLTAADAILHAGDFMELGVLHELQALGPPVHAVRGNVDSHELIVRLPLQRVVAFGDVRIGMVHDAGHKDGRLARMRRRFPDADAVVFGHSHIPLHEERDGFQIFNPGSPTERRRQPRHTMGLAHIEDTTLTFELITL
jgi:putative phosphoesterase